MTHDDIDQPASPDLLRLLALDEEDLAVVSANLQDAVVRLDEMAYLPRERRFALLAARFDWVSAECARCRTGVHFDYVTKVAQTGIKQGDPEGVLNLLSMSFTTTDAPAGVVTLTFSGGAAVRLEVECLEAQMRDLGPRWAARARPGHTLDDVSET